VGSSVNVSYGPTRSGDVRDSQADITRAREILGYKPIVSFEEGLRHTLEWYRTEADTVARR
jgi:nucleoside-diphosphate-sugar epimerase